MGIKYLNKANELFSNFNDILKPNIDSSGNVYYQQDNPTEEYWLRKDPKQYHQIIRECTRINIKIE